MFVLHISKFTRHYVKFLMQNGSILLKEHTALTNFRIMIKVPGELIII